MESNLISNIFTNASQIIPGTNSTHFNGTYVENPLSIGMSHSLIWTFVCVFLSELGDKTFILILILKIKSSNYSIVFLASLLSMTFTTFISVCLGTLMDMFLYQNFIDILGTIVLVGLGVSLIVSSFSLDNQTFEEDMIDVIKGELRNEKEKKKITRQYSILQRQISFLSSSSLENLRDESRQPLIQKTKSTQRLQELDEELYGNGNDKFLNVNMNISDDNKDIDYQELIRNDTINAENYFWIFLKSIFITEFFDRTQVSMITISSIYNTLGVALGALLALLSVIALAIFFGENLSKRITEKYMAIVTGVLFTAVGIEILYSNQFLA